MSKKISVAYVCKNCGLRVLKWAGRCVDCSEWNSFEEEEVSGKRVVVKGEIENIPKRVGEVEVSHYERKLTGISEFDRVLGGGIVIGSLTLVGGEPGIGKSTLLTEVLAKLSKRYNQESILYISGEESIHQIAQRSNRLGLKGSEYYIYNETNWQKILGQIKKFKPSVIVLDSIQTTVSSDIASSPGSISQIREVTYELMNHVKGSSTTCFVVGHITKEGTIAGPKILEHMVDSVIYFEGDQLGNYRILRSIKNRFGNTNEVGIFEMKEDGLKEVKNPSQYFLESDSSETFGRSLSCINEGTRPLFIEIQALVVENKYGNGRRTTQGVDVNRLAMIVAIIEKYLGIPMGYNDIYLNIVGGFKIKTQDTDLSIIASLLSSYRNKKIEEGIIFLGEVGLNGEVRSVTHIEKRIKEMEQLNYKKVITSKKISLEYQKRTKLKLIGLKRINELEKVVSL